MYQNYQIFANANGSYRYMAQTLNGYVSEIFKDIESPALHRFQAYQEQIDLMALTHQRPALR